MSTPEQKIYDKLVSAFARLLSKGRYRCQRVESSTGTGIPDVYFRSGKYSCWLETKTRSYSVSKEQCAWAHLERLAGGEVFIVTVINNDLAFIPLVGSMSSYSSLGAWYRSKVSQDVPILTVDQWVSEE